jgi:prophage regulatory protein
MPQPQRVYRFPDLKAAGVPYSRRHVERLMGAGQFPQHFDLGPNSVGWVAAEVDAWIEAKIRARTQPRPLRGGPLAKGHRELRETPR